MVKNIVFWKTSFGSRKSGFLDRGTQNDTLQYVRKTNLARLLGCKIQGLPIYLVRYSGHTAFKERSHRFHAAKRAHRCFREIYGRQLLPPFWNQHSKAMQVDMVGGLRLSPAISPLSSSYLAAIFTIDANLVPAISGYLPAISTIHVNVVPAISGYLRLSSPIYGFFPGYLRLSPAISRLSSRYLQVLACFILMFSSVMTL